MRAAVVDIGTNSTRLLIADVDPTSGSVNELLRRSRVTRLGEGVDARGELAEASMDRVFATLSEYRAAIDEHDVTANLAVLTSAVRDASNGAGFAARVRDDFGLDARVLSGEEEAQLTFLGAMSASPPSGAKGATVVIDIGGGSTEFIVGRGREASFHVSLPVGVVRMSERHIHSDPPEPAQLQELGLDVRETFDAGLPANERSAAGRGIAVAGTATSAAAIELELDPYDPARVEGHRLLLGTTEMLLARVAEMDEAQRRAIVGLDPARAPAIIAGFVVLCEAMHVLGLDEVTVSEHDILVGGALRLAGA